MINMGVLILILIIDHNDSFTFNLYQYFVELGEEVEVVNTSEMDKFCLESFYDAVVLSPGPGKPNCYPNTMDFISKYYNGIPILGVCLGHQILAEFFGGKIGSADSIKHGKMDILYHSKKAELFKDTPEKFIIGRYHSWIVKELPRCLNMTAWTVENEIMSFEHRKLPIFGLQYHPESILSEYGYKVLKNFINMKETHKIGNSNRL